MSDSIKDINFTDFNLSQNAYTAFDAVSLRSLITDRLTKDGLFTDQIYEGSNMSSIIDIIAYSYHVLLFYLNQTANESLFSESQLYENMNRIVKLINYKPVGYQTSVLSIKTTCSNSLPISTYTIPRYSFVDIGGIKMTTKDDITFSKITAGDNELIRSIGDNNLLYEGTVVEASTRAARGAPFESITIPTQSQPIDMNTISVFVLDSSGSYTEYIETTSLFLENESSHVFEKRYNEDGDYEIKFGNNITGAMLNAGDIVSIYYIESSGQAGIVGKEAINDKKFILYSTPQFLAIRDSIKSPYIKYLTASELQYISIQNINRSTTPKDKETVEDIRKNAPISFQNQERLITVRDFTQRISRRFGNILTDVATVNNKEYIDTYVKYFHDTLGLNKPNLESRSLLNQLYFASTTNFNNVYAYCVPRLENKTSTNIQTNFLTVGQKNTIKSSLERDKILSSEVSFVDPVYMAIDIYPVDPAIPLDLSKLQDTKLIIIKDRNSQFSNDRIKQEVNTVLSEHFKFVNNRLGQTIDITRLVSTILGINGVFNVFTSITGTDIRVPGVSLLVWNPISD